MKNKTNVPAGSKDKELYTSDLANLIEKRLQNKCVGYQFVISYKENFSDMRSGGYARQGLDLPIRNMSIFDQYNIASVAKPITGAALLKLLAKNPDVNRDSKMWPFLPSHWRIPKSVKAITFRHLLTHTSGFKTGAHIYADLKTMVEKGINESDLGHADYDNSNYNLMRLIIPKLAGYVITDIPDNTREPVLIISEANQALSFANDYMDYVQKNLFSPGGLPELFCRPIESNSAKFYRFPNISILNGEDLGDYTLKCGSGGWNMSSAQLSVFFRTLHHTEKIIPASISSLMITEGLCYITGTTSTGIDYYWKPGGWSETRGHLSTIIIGFSNDIIVTTIMNSEGPGLEESIIDAFNEWYH